MASSGASGCEFELIDGGRLRVCFCQKCDCFLGKGSYGKVFKATATQGEKEAVAIKFPNGPCHVEYEIAILQRLDHPNILKYYRKFRFGFIRYVELKKNYKRSNIKFNHIGMSHSLKLYFSYLIAIRVLETELCNGTLHDLVVSLKLYDDCACLQRLRLVQIL